DWFEAPETRALEQALELLEQLGAIDTHGVTPLGRHMVGLPVHPRLARLAIEGTRHGYPSEAALCAALLSERDPFERRFDRSHAPTGRSRSDVLDRLDALIAHEAHRPRPERIRLNTSAARFILKSRGQLVRRLKPLVQEKTLEREEALLRAVLAGYPDRVAKRREPGSKRALMVGGRGVQLAPESAVLDPELFVCVALRAGMHSEALVHIASEVKAAWLPNTGITSGTELAFDPDRERVTAFRRTRYNDLILSETNAQPQDHHAVARVLADAARERLDAALDLSRPDVASLLLRLRFLNAWMPELGLPDMNRSALEALLPSLCHGRRSFDELRQQPLGEIIRGTMGHTLWSALEREAPERLQVPSGSHIRLTYREEGPPILAVRIQEMFGLHDTPRIAGQRVAVLLHLLAPNMRPQQITHDLKSFWHNTYPEVRKELRQRYPKHAWPEDPWNAAPERRPRRKRR
ncbi:MAG: ATP-dependent helicase C-terminal domain-containing protein, partial [Myxococcota bacterium]